MASGREGREQDRRLLASRTSQFALGALSVVLLSQAALVLWVAMDVNRQGRKLGAAIDVNDAFRAAAEAAANEHAAQLAALRGPSPEARTDFAAAAAALGNALDRVRRLASAGPAGGAGSAFASALADRHHRHVADVERALDAAALGAGQAAGGELDEGITSIEHLLAPAVGRTNAEVRELLDAQRHTERLLVRATPVGFTAGLVLVGLCAAVITAHRNAAGRGTDAAVRSERRFRSLVEHSDDMILLLHRGRGVSYASPASERVLGYDPETLIAIPREHLFHPDDLVKFAAARERCAATPGLVVRPVMARARGRDGVWRWLEMSLSNRLDDPDVAGIVVNARDVTDRKAAEAALSHNATHDDLTGLPNRTLLLDRISRALGRFARRGRPLAVLLCDLDRFKVLNDSRGHAEGDQVLRAVARRLRAAIGPEDTLARLGSDEFVICGEGVGDQLAAHRLADRVREALAPAFETSQGEIFLTASIGIRLAAARTDSAEDLVRDAEAAMHHAKAEGRDRVVLYREVLREQSEARLTIEAALRRALERNELRVHYQPVVSVVEGDLVGFEALVRWEHPRRGLVPPAEFIDVAEDTGLIEPIGAWVLEEACAQLHRWTESGAAKVEMAVNVSGRQLESGELVDTVADVLQRTGVEPSTICLEVTESVLMRDPEAAARKLAALHDLGVRVAIDDFGTGYSSLAHLRRFPVDHLKIDRSFVSTLGDEPEATAIVTAIVHLAHSLHLSTIAEGVETAAQRTQLRLLGCEYAQGYHWGRPEDAEHLEPWLSHAELPPAPAPATEPVGGRRYSVLVADDDPSHRTMVRRILERAGRFDVVADAEDGRAAVDQAVSLRPDLVLLDLSMPNVSGLEALPMILAGSPGTRVVLLSGSGIANAKGLPGGAAAFVGKGGRPQELVDQLLVVMGDA